MIAIKNNVLRLVKTETVKRTTDIGVGQKNVATMRILKELTKTMRDSGNCIDDIKKFQYDFCEQNGISVPSIFLTNSSENSIKSFVEKCLEKSSGNTSVKEVYEVYVNFCHKNGINAEGKQDFICGLKHLGLWCERAMVRGKQARNVIKNMQLQKGVDESHESN